MATFVDWLANGSPPWAAYCTFMLVRLIALEEKPGVRPVGVGETWRHLFANTMIKATGTEENMECQDYQLCAGRKAVIDGAIH